jgi:predicted DNA-binding transcriptional regulator YafY
MRASRLVALLLHLQSRGSATAPELAERLGVSVRTIYRDIDALQAAGAPLWTETGPRGGVRLVDGWRTDLDGLTSEEAAALFLGAPGVADDLGLGPVLAAAQVKMLAALSPEAAVRASDARARFLLDAPAWFRRDDPTPLLGSLAAAVWSDRRVDLRYATGERLLDRRVDPLGLVLKAGVWYLLARHRGALRTYRVSRIRSLTSLDTTAARPADFDLARAWAETSAEFDRSILHDVVRLRVNERGAQRLPIAVPTVATRAALAEADPPDDDGWRLVVLPVESEAIAHSQLFGLGADVEVVAPESLRRSIASSAADVVARYSTG